MLVAKFIDDEHQTVGDIQLIARWEVQDGLGNSLLLELGLQDRLVDLPDGVLTSMEGNAVELTLGFVDPSKGLFNFVITDHLSNITQQVREGRHAASYLALRADSTRLGSISIAV